MVETHRATSKINKQQSVKGSKTVTQVPEQKRWIIMDWKTHTHKHTLKMNSLTCSLELQSHKRQPATSKADRQTSKEHPGKYHGKTRQEKGTTQKWICTMPCIMLHHHETRMQQKYSMTSMPRRQQRLSQFKNSIIKVHRYANYESFKSIKQEANSVQTHSKSR